MLPLNQTPQEPPSNQSFGYLTTPNLVGSERRTILRNHAKELGLEVTSSLWEVQLETDLAALKNKVLSSLKEITEKLRDPLTHPNGSIQAASVNVSNLDSVFSAVGTWRSLWIKGMSQLSISNFNDSASFKLPNIKSPALSSLDETLAMHELKAHYTLDFNMEGSYETGGRGPRWKLCAFVTILPLKKAS